MSRLDTAELRQVLESNPEPYLLEHSGLPGPRANLELARAVAETARPDLLWRLATWGPARAPANSPEEFLAFCGVVGLGRLAVQGEEARALETLQRAAGDPRWRIREAVAMALQVYGRSQPDRLAVLMAEWATGDPLQQRAALAAVCEPDLLENGELVDGALGLLDRFMAVLTEATDRRNEALRVLRQALGYCWSVVVASHPQLGQPRFEAWMDSADPDILWVLRENLQKKRLVRFHGEWVEAQLQRLDARS